MPTTATSCFATTAGSLKGMSTATTRYSIWVINGKASAHQAIDIVNLATVDVTHAHLIYQDVKTVLRNDSIALLLFIKSHTILETRATTTCDKNAQGKAGVVFLRKQFTHFVRCGRRHINDACLNYRLLVLLNHVFLPLCSGQKLADKIML